MQGCPLSPSPELPNFGRGLEWGWVPSFDVPVFLVHQLPLEEAGDWQNSGI